MRINRLIEQPDREKPAVNPQTLIAAGVVGLGAIGLYVVSQGTMPQQPVLFTGMVLLLVSESMKVLAWVAAAAGYGRGLWWALGGSRGQWAATMALGVGTLAMIDWTLGVLGLLTPASAWGVTVGGWAVLGAWAYRRRERWYRRPERWPTLPWAVLPAVPAMALMFGACAAPPGTLWAVPGEARGYDVLSYHLQLPKEWITLGRIDGLEHNVYSFMPSLFEAAYMHLGLCFGSMVHAAYASQLLHASMAVIAAAAVGQIGAAHTGKIAAGAFAAAVYLSLPWTIVTGSMAYNEQFIAALGIAAIGLAMNRDGSIGFGIASRSADALSIAPPTAATSLRLGLVVGLLVGFAALGKLTALGMFAMPAGLILLARTDGGRRAWALRCLGGALGGAAVIAPFLARNAVWTGNPLFPLFCDVFGSDHWTADQVARWNAMWRPEGSPLDSLAKLWEMALATPLFGWAFWPAAVVALGIALLHRRVRWPVSMIATAMAAQLFFWLFFTHHQSRFLVPMVGPGCAAIALAIGAWRRGPHALRVVAGVAFVAVLTVVGYALYLAPANQIAPLLIDRIEERLRPDPVHGPAFPAAAINALPPASRVYAEGWATPFYALGDVGYHTVWDRSELGSALDAGGRDGARRWLRDARYTHVVIDWTMLSIWLSEGNYGYDPRITLESLKSFADDALEPMQHWGDPRAPIVLYKVR